MNNTEIDIEQILNQITITGRKNKILEIFETLQTTKLFPLQSCVFLSLEYFYDSGYKHFRSAEWGFNDVNSLNYKDKLLTKPYGDLIRAIYNLCKESHALQKIANVTIPYSDTYTWFTNCILELPMHDLEYLTSPSREKFNFVEMWKERIKTLESLAYPPNYLDVESQQFAPYTPEYNPFLSARCTKYSQGLVLLVECAYSLAATIPNFKKKYWEPFIQAQKSIVSVLEKPHHLDMIRLSRTEDGSLEYQKASKTAKGKKAKYSKPKKLM